MFETRSDAWEQVGLSFDVNKRVVKKSQREAVLFLVLVIAVYVGSRILLDNRTWNVTVTGKHGPIVKVHYGTYLTKWGIGGADTAVKILSVILVLALGWALARSIGRFVGPTFFRRMDPATAGTVGFIVRLLTMLIAAAVALRVAGASLGSLAVTGAFTAVVLGLAAQQTLGNVFAGLVLLSARPFRVGERVRLQAGALSGQIDGVVSSLGLLYTTLTRGGEKVMIPNTQVLAAVIVPLREPDGVDVKVRLSSGVTPSQVQAILDQQISIPTRTGTSVNLEEVDGDDVVVRVQATPEMPDEGAKLADEIMLALSSVTGEHEAAPSNGR
jgi:small conductance mechanosensitive channel